METPILPQNSPPGDMHQLNVFKKKLTLAEVTDMYYSGRCAEMRPTLAKDIAISWEDILREGILRGDVTMEDSECANRNIL